MNKHDRVVLITGIVVLAAMLLSAFALGSDEIVPDAMEGLSERWFDELSLDQETLKEGGRMTQAGQTDSFEIDGFERAVKNITATVVWKDEPDERMVRQYQNQPDQFSIQVLNPNGTSVGSDSGSNQRAATGGEGEIEVQISLTDEDMNLLKDSGNWTVEVTLESIGDYEARIGAGLWPVKPSDTGNDFDISINVDYYDLAKEE